MEYFFIIAVVVILFAGTYLLRFRPKKLTARQSARYRKILASLSELEPRFAILECDRVFENILKDLGYVGTVGDTLKKKWSIFPELQVFWKYHKLRNRIVHDATPPTVTLRDVQEFRRSIEDAFCKE